MQNLLGLGNYAKNKLDIANNHNDTTNKEF